MAEIRPLIRSATTGKVEEFPNNGDTLPASIMPSGANAYQKYFVQMSEVYTIPIYISSVVTGSFISEGSTVVNGKLEVI